MHLAAADSRFDLSLRFLSLVVSGAIALALAWHFAGVLTPLMRLGDAPLPLPAVRLSSALELIGPPAWASQPEAVTPALEHGDARAPAVTVFRCEQRGSVTYSDRPCDRGGQRVLRAAAAPDRPSCRVTT